jgi:hypothetical protein
MIVTTTGAAGFTKLLLHKFSLGLVADSYFKPINLTTSRIRGVRLSPPTNNPYNPYIFRFSGCYHR